MTRISAEDARDRLDDLIDQAADAHEPLLIQGRAHAAVLLSEDDWRSVQETMYLVSIPGMRESLREGLAADPDACDEDPGW